MNYLIYFSTLLISIKISRQNIVPSQLGATTSPTVVIPTLKEKFGGNDYCQFGNDAEKHCAARNSIPGCPNKLPDKTRGCLNMVVQTMNESDINNILGSINGLRSRIARGTYSSFEKATKMKQVYWDQELQYLAEWLLDQCSVSRDVNICYVKSNGEKAFGTVKYKTVKYTTQANVVKEILQVWESDTESFGQSHDKLIYNNAFDSLVYMIHDEVDRMGCAVGTFRFQSDNKVSLFCVYNKFLKVSDTIYKTGKETCSECKTYGERYECVSASSLCYIPQTIEVEINTETGEETIKYQETLMNVIGNNFTIILIGSAIGIAVLTIATSYIKMRFFM